MPDAILPLSNNDARELCGKRWIVDGQTYYFKAYVPGQPPWRTGSEGKAFPLLNERGDTVAYVKFFSSTSTKRLDRTQWLVGKELHGWCPQLKGSPRRWFDSREIARPENISFDITCCLAHAAPGETWLELKCRLRDAKATLDDGQRFQCVRDLIQALATLEDAGIVHGDLSPQNIMVDTSANAGPLLYLIDFDGFVAPKGDSNLVLYAAEGGTYGTDGYCPSDLTQRALQGETRLAPYSDRHARDMLILELLFSDVGGEIEKPPGEWDGPTLEGRFSSLIARCPSDLAKTLSHVAPPTVFSKTEDDRPSSMSLAQALGLPVVSPPSPFLVHTIRFLLNWPAWVSFLLGALLLWSERTTETVPTFHLWIALIGIGAGTLGWRRANKLGGGGRWASGWGFCLNSAPVLILTVSMVTTWVSSKTRSQASATPAAPSMHSEGQSVVLSGIPQPASGGDNATGAGREGMLPVEQPDRSFDDRARVFRLLSCVRETTQIRCSFTVTNESSTDATLYLNNSDDPTLAIPEISELTDRSGRNFAATSCEIEGQESVYSRDINSGPTCVRRGITPGTTVKGMVGFQGVDPTVKTIAILSIAYETYDGAGGVAFFKNVPVKS